MSYLRHGVEGSAWSKTQRERERRARRKSTTDPTRPPHSKKRKKRKRKKRNAPEQHNIVSSHDDTHGDEHTPSDRARVLAHRLHEGQLVLSVGAGASFVDESIDVGTGGLELSGDGVLKGVVDLSFLGGDHRRRGREGWRGRRKLVMRKNGRG